MKFLVFKTFETSISFVASFVDTNTWFLDGKCEVRGTVELRAWWLFSYCNSFACYSCSKSKSGGQTKLFNSGLYLEGIAFEDVISFFKMFFGSTPRFPFFGDLKGLGFFIKCEVCGKALFLLIILLDSFSYSGTS